MYAAWNKGHWPKISLKIGMFILITFTCIMICCSIIAVTVLNSRESIKSIPKTSGEAKTLVNIPGTLFEKPKKSAIKEATPPPAVSVKLPLLLKGVLTSTDTRRSLAILQGPSGQQSYREGEKLADVENAYLESVKADEVQIRTPRGIAILYLNDKSRENKHLKPEKEKANKEHAKYLMHYLVANPIYKDEKLTGYRFNPRTNSNIYLRAGLIPGEVVIKINGQPLDDTATADKYIEQLASLRDVQLTVLRESQLQNIYINLATIETSLDTESHEEVH
ncbi:MULTISPECIES: type II secretion system protein GspC [unclassified Rahnella]|uniref:type II secretion system protein GspC n=1 Tax=unclassified Rahnella TaxID=2635087 RepID=UPI00101FF121|nr:MULTISPECIES: type II secretion system protein GspC [unclassified Rahnella]